MPVPAYPFAETFAEEDAPVRQATALGLKLAAYLVIFGVTRPILGLMSLPQSMILAAVLTLLLWMADLVVLPRLGNLVATMGDCTVLFVVTLLVCGAMLAVPDFARVLVAVAAGTAFEWWFHRWLEATAIVE
jgi:hypothetical protein